MIQLLLYLATIPAANWMIGNVGTACLPQGPCFVPVGFGLTAPSGVVVIGIALVLRDLVHRDLGARWAAAGVAAGAVLSFAIAPPPLAVASFLAFAASEALDQAVYTPLRRRRLVLRWNTTEARVERFVRLAQRLDLRVYGFEVRGRDVTVLTHPHEAGSAAPAPESDPVDRWFHENAPSQESQHAPASKIKRIK